MNKQKIARPAQKLNEIKIQGTLTSRIETRNKDKETYYYGFFQIANQNQEIPIVFKTKPEIPKGSQLEELKELEKFSQLGEQYLKAHLLTKSARYANYQSEYLEQANLNQASYLARMASELEITKRQMLAMAKYLKDFSCSNCQQAISEQDIEAKNYQLGVSDYANEINKEFTTAQLQREINQLKSENQQLRLLLHTIVLTASQAVNREPESETSKEYLPSKTNAKTVNEALWLLVKTKKGGTMAKIEKHLKFTCPQCFSTYQLLEIHEKENNPCPTNCPKQWQALLNKHYQDCIILNLAREEAQKEETHD
ncbi:2911_t:CDS:2 [Entrophospora sp. SA101]|nr:2911_t:CDS:2 [Entrophospora sp. SA101]